MIWLPVVGNYADVDVYASIIAYAELLNRSGKRTRTYIPSAPNYSVPDKLRMPDGENAVWNFDVNDQAVILDISVPEAVNRLVPDKQILEIIDHHPGYEEYWKEQIGDKSTIQKIGAVATIIFERWCRTLGAAEMSPDIAKLLLAAILDNTLNFNANITTERDRKAAKMLAKIANMTVIEFAEWYFSEVSQTIVSDLDRSLSQDCKTINYLPGQPQLRFGQLAIWDAKEIIGRRPEIVKIMSDASQDWVVSVICISERKNYIITSSVEDDNYFIKLLGLTRSGEWLISDRLYLRKEIIGKIQQTGK